MKRRRETDCESGNLLNSNHLIIQLDILKGGKERETERGREKESERQKRVRER